MRILSSFHDYYDTVQSFGQDQSLLYLREKQEKVYSYECKWRGKVFGNWPFPSQLGHGIYGPYGREIIVGLCGKLYPAFYIRPETDFVGKSVFPEKYCYSMEELDSTINERCSKKEWGYYSGENRRAYSRGGYRKTYEKFFQEFATFKNEEIFYENKSPIFVARQQKYTSTIEKPVITFNDCLNDVDFVRIVPPFEAYQQISMFVNNIGRPEPYVPTPSDKDMVEIKGFNKYSFRKPKSN